MNDSFQFNNTYACLPARLFERQQPEPVAEPRLLTFNQPLSDSLKLDFSSISDEQKASWFSGNTLPFGSDPLAMAYAGHQFGHFVPQLGDGRALLLGEVSDSDGLQWDIQLKGSGRTPFSRGGDGRSALGPVMREYLVSEAMHALGVPTTRALAAVTTGQSVQRDTLLPGAIMTRVARSHLRVGTFQYFSARQDTDAIRTLVNFACRRLYPELSDSENKAIGLLRQVIAAQAKLVAHWLAVGFVHGVMNTDNCAISGETIDYGPCAFLDEYDPAKVFSSIDRNGRYAYANQPKIAFWNLARLAETLLPLIDPVEALAVEQANVAIEVFPDQFKKQWLSRMRAKLGLNPDVRDAASIDPDLIQDFLNILHAEQADFTLAFRTISHAVAEPSAIQALPAALGFSQARAINAWTRRWLRRLECQPESRARCQRHMLAANPALIPRNHQIQRAIDAAEQGGDFSVFDALHAALAKPYQEVAEFQPFQRPPRPGQRVLETFCGT